MTTRCASRVLRRVLATVISFGLGVVLMTGCSHVSHPKGLDRSARPTSAVSSGQHDSSNPTPTSAPVPTGASASAEFITDSDGLLALKTPIKIGDRMGPDLPWAGPPPTGPPTPESALIFMRAYLASRTVSLYKMSPDPVSAYLDPGCPCARMLALIKEHSVKRQHFVGPSLVINDLHVNQVRSNKILVGVDTSQGTDHLVDDNGNEVGDDAAVSHLKATYVLDFDHAKNVWHISQALG